VKPFKVAAVQMNALKDDLEHNLRVHAKFIRKAAKEECRLVMFPELSVTAHYGDQQVLQFAEPAGRGKIFDFVAEQAAQHKIVVGYGFCERAHGTHYNSFGLISAQGELIGVQRKIHASKDEYFSFRMGRSLETFDIGFCRIGILICYDSCFFEAWRVLALLGAEVILEPHASRSGWAKRISRAKQIERLKRQRPEQSVQVAFAKSNAVFAVYGNQSGYNGHSTHAGGAYIVAPNGKRLAKSVVSPRDQIIMAALDPGALRTARNQPHCTLRTRRPELYGELTRMI